MSRCQKLPLCPTEPMPAGCETDLPLNKLPISNGGSASGIAYLRREKKPAVRREECEYVRERTRQAPRSGKKEGEEVLQAPEQRDSPAARGEDHGEAGCPPAAHGG